MRIIIILLALLPVTLQATQTPRSTVLLYECKQVNKLNVGFTCGFNKDGEMHLQWHVKHTQLSKTERERSIYEFEKIALRYMHLGGRHFIVTFDHWAKGKERVCGRHPSKVFYKYICTGP